MRRKYKWTLAGKIKRLQAALKRLEARNESRPVGIDAAAALWREGKSQIAIAKEFGVTVNVVAGLINRNRAKFPRRSLPKNFQPRAA